MDKSKYDKPEAPCLECGKMFDDCQCDYFNIGSTAKYEKLAEKMVFGRNKTE
jgi:hypothetical protein